VNAAVYRTGVDASRGSNPISNLSDGIFADSLASEIVTPSGAQERVHRAVADWVPAVAVELLARRVIDLRSSADSSISASTCA